MVQQGTPEQYFGTGVQRIIIGEPVDVVQPIHAKVVEPVQVQDTVQAVDYTPLVLGVCFLGTVVLVLGLGFLFLVWKEK